MKPWPAWVPQWARPRIVVTRSGCWRWTGPLTDTGYAWAPRGPHKRAHRALWAASGRELPPRGYVLDHACHDPAECQGGPTCPHRRCVNPEHLRPVTPAQNVAAGRRAGWASGTCRRGHDVTDPAAIYVRPNGERECRACRTLARAGEL